MPPAVELRLYVSSPAQPGSDRWLELADFFRLEIQGDFALGRFRPVRGVDQVHLPTGAEVAANRAGRGFQAAGGAQHVADHANALQSLDNRGHDRTAGNELFQRRVPALFDVLGIVLLGQRRRNAHHLQGHDIETFIFEPTQHAAGQAALNAVGLEQNQRAFHVDVSGMIG